MGRRREDSVALILRSAMQGITRPRLMYETYLPYDALNEYVSTLISDGLLEYQRGEMKFRTTPAGCDLLTSSEIELGCTHQCKKCGVVYGCQTKRCKTLFQGGTCVQCSKILTCEASPEKAAAAVAAVYESTH